MRSTFTNACNRIDNIADNQNRFPLADQVKIQAGIILSGLLAS